MDQGAANKKFQEKKKQKKTCKQRSEHPRNISTKLAAVSSRKAGLQTPRSSYMQADHFDLPFSLK